MRSSHGPLETVEFIWSGPEMVLGLKLSCNVRLPFEEVKLLLRYSVVASVSMSGATADIMFASQVRAWTSHEHQLSN